MKFFRCSVPLLSVFLILVSTFLPSCKKDPYTIGLTLLPSSDTLNIRHSDSVSVFAYSALQDSVRTDKATTGIVGSFIDPVFGKTTASLITQVMLSSEGPYFGTNPGLDSLVLMLKYTGSYGDVSTIQNVKVYELSEDLNYDSIYYSNKTVAHYNTLLANLSFKPRPTDSVKVDTTKEAPQLRINLSNLTHYLGNKILYAPTAMLAANIDFIGFIKGLSIESSPVYDNGALLTFDLSDGASMLIVYYHNQENDSIHYDIPILSGCAHFNHFDHNKYRDASPDFRRQLVNHDTTLGTSKLYLQGLGGVWTKIKLPHIKDFEKGHHIAINSAILQVKNYETDTTLAPPEDLILVQRDTAGILHSLVDAAEGTSYYGGTYNKTSRTYQFRITRHIQQILLGTGENNDLYLMVNNPYYNVLTSSRVILTGTKPGTPSAESDRIQVKISYVRLD